MSVYNKQIQQQIKHHARLRTFPPEKRGGITRVGRLVPSMLGKFSNPCLSLKASETKHFFPYILKLLREFRDRLNAITDAAALIRAGEAVQLWMDTIARNSRVLTPATCDLLVRTSLEHNRFAQQGGVLVKPKHHGFIHASIDSKFKGNPRFLQSYFDEGLNKVVDHIAARCHRLTFERRLPAKFHRCQHDHVMEIELWF